MNTLFPSFLIYLVAALSLQSQTNAQSLVDTTKITQSCMMYIDGFVDGKPELLAECLSEELYKFGFRLNEETKLYEHAGILTYKSAQDLAKKIGDSGGRDNPEAPKEIEILDIQGPIASVKITAIWGYDYVLLAKKNDQWKIEQVLWVGPLEK